MSKFYYFIDTRQDAKTAEPFGIANKDVAKLFANEFKLGEGPFMPVEAPEEFQVQTLVEGPENVTAGQNDIDPGVYAEMTVAELHDELTARDIEFKQKQTKAELINLLLKDDGNGGE